MSDLWNSESLPFRYERLSDQGMWYCGELQGHAPFINVGASHHRARTWPVRTG